MDNPTVQYVATGIILLASVAYLALMWFRRRRRDRACASCPLAKTGLPRD